MDEHRSAASKLRPGGQTLHTIVHGLCKSLNNNTIFLTPFPC